MKLYLFAATVVVSQMCSQMCFGGWLVDESPKVIQDLMENGTVRTGDYILERDLALAKERYARYITQANEEAVWLAHPGLPGVWVELKKNATALRLVKPDPLSQAWFQRLWIKGWVIWIIVLLLIGFLAGHFRVYNRAACFVNKILQSAQSTQSKQVAQSTQQS